MRRFLGRPTVWIWLVVFSFVMNLFLAVVTLHLHIRKYPEGFVSSDEVELLPTTLTMEKTNQTPEGELWRRMLQQDFSSSGCTSGWKTSFESHSTTITTKTGGLVTSIQLLPKGFQDHVKDYVNKTTSIHRESNVRSSLRGLSSSSDRIQGPSTCYFPAETACSKTQYSVLMYSQASDLRRLMLNLMACMAYPSIHDITLILPSTDASLSDLLRSDSNSYGSRISDWKDQGTIQIVSQSTLWESISQVKVKESGILWIDGDRRKTWNGTKFRTIFRSWRQNSRAIIATSLDEDGPNRVNNDTTSSWTIVRDGLHGAMLHRDWLCFLQHPVVEPLRRYLEPEGSWGSILSALTILFNQLGEGHILLRPKGERRHVKATDHKTVQGLIPPSSERMSNILNYFGFICIKDVFPFRINSTCVERYEEQDSGFETQQ